MLSRVVVDDHPSVRLAAVNALREAGGLEATELALRALNHPTDENLDYALWLTAREGSQAWLTSLQSGQLVFDGKIDRLGFALRAANSPDVLNPLATLVEDGKLSTTAQRDALQILAGLGGPDALDLVLRSAVKDQDPKLWTGLAAAARSNDATPGDIAPLLTVFRNSNIAVRLAAVELAGRWKLAAAAPLLEHILLDRSSDDSERLAAATALAKVGRIDTLKRLSSPVNSQPVRTAATCGWASLQPAAAASTAADLLADLTSASSAEPVFHAFLDRKQGDKFLAEALTGKTMQASVAAAGIRAGQRTGRSLAELESALTAAGTLRSTRLKLSVNERTALLKEMLTDGDPARGERIYRRASMACARCHAIGGAGGQLGPDLGSLGAHMTPQSILESLLNPGTTVKQGYETVIVERKDGRIQTGTLQRKTDRFIRLRSPDAIITIPTGDVESTRTQATSMMPAGLTMQLRRDELIDLVRFLTVLGNAEGFKLTTAPIVRRWQVYDPKLEIWTPAYSTVAGTLPIAEIPRDDKNARRVRFSHKLTAPAKLSLNITDPNGIQLSVNGGTAADAGKSSTHSLEAGTHAFTLIVQESNRTKPIRVELQSQK